MDQREITASALDVSNFSIQQKKKIRRAVGDGLAINALSGGVDSSCVTMLAYQALGDQLETIFVDNGLMREGEPERVVEIFRGLGVPVILLDAREEFLFALKGISDPERKRQAITDTFYQKIFGERVKKTGAKTVLHGTILTDVEETVDGIKRQHNIFEQIGIDPQKEFGYQILEPLVQLRKDGVRVLAKAMGLPVEIYNRKPFPGPALAARIQGVVTARKLEMVRLATQILEDVVVPVNAFQEMAILKSGRCTGMRGKKRVYGREIEIRIWESVDARTATPIRLDPKMEDRLVKWLLVELQEVVSVTFARVSKPPSTMEIV